MKSDCEEEEQEDLTDWSSGTLVAGRPVLPAAPADPGKFHVMEMRTETLYYILLYFPHESKTSQAGDGNPIF